MQTPTDSLDLSKSISGVKLNLSGNSTGLHIFTSYSKWYESRQFEIHALLLVVIATPNNNRSIYFNLYCFIAKKRNIGDGGIMAGNQNLA